MITIKNGVTTISKGVAREDMPLATMEDLNATQQAQDLEELQKPQTPSAPIEGSETASLQGMLGRKSIGMFRSTFIKDLQGSVAPPKAYVEAVNRDNIQAIQSVTDVMQPQDLIGRSAGEFDDAATYQIKWNTLDNADDVNGMIGAMAEHHKVEMEKARGGIRKDEEIIKLSDDLGTDPKFIAEFLNSKESMYVEPEKILAARKFVNASARKLKELADDIHINGKNDTQTLFDFNKQYAMHQQFIKQFMGKRANIGRSMRAFSLPTGTKAEQYDAMNEMLLRSNTGITPELIAAQLSTVEGVQGINLAVQAQDGLFKKLGNVFIETYINSILSGIKTQVINNVGSVMSIGMRKFDTFVAARLGTPFETGAEKVLKDEWKALFFADMNGFMDALHTAGQVLKTGEQYGGVARTESTRRPAITAEYLGVGGRAGALIDTLGEVIRAPTERIMGSTDAFYKKIVENEIVSQLAFRKGNYEGASKGLNQQDTLDLVKYYYNNPTQEMIIEASEEAMHDTFQTALKRDSVWKKIQNVAASNPLFTYIMPFVKTPANLMLQGFLERTPLGLVTSEFQEAVRAGGARAQMAQARMINGTSLALAFSVPVMQGNVTGGGSQDLGVKKTMMESGWRPYSLKYTDDNNKTTYYDIKRLEPFNYPLTVMADMWDLQKVRTKLGEDDENYMTKFSSALTIAFSKATLDRTTMIGVSNVLGALTKGDVNAMERIIKSTGSLLVPSASRDIARMFDDSRVITDSILDEMKSKTPYYNAKLPKVRDAFGEIVPFDTILNPFANVEESKDPVYLEMARVADATQKSPTTLPDRKYESIKLTNEQYHDLILLSRKLIQIDGKNYKQAVKEVINSPIYGKMIDENKVISLTSIKSMYDQAGRYTLAKHDKSFMDKLLGVKTEKEAAQSALLKGTSAEGEQMYMKENLLKGIQGLDLYFFDKNKELFYNKEK